jgi:hypothetical protein
MTADDIDVIEMMKKSYGEHSKIQETIEIERELKRNQHKIKTLRNIKCYKI